MKRRAVETTETDELPNKQSISYLLFFGAPKEQPATAAAKGPSAHPLKRAMSSLGIVSVARAPVPVHVPRSMLSSQEDSPTAPSFADMLKSGPVVQTRPVKTRMQMIESLDSGGLLSRVGDTTTDFATAISWMVEFHSGCYSRNVGLGLTIREVAEYRTPVDAAELSDLLDWVWERYFPNGLPLNKEERIEVHDMLHQWFGQRSKLQLLPGSGRPNSRPFNVFAKWFSQLMEALERQRIVTWASPERTRADAMAARNFAAVMSVVAVPIKATSIHSIMETYKKLDGQAGRRFSTVNAFHSELRTEVDLFSPEWRE
jgi:hypothetical protein